MKLRSRITLMVSVCFVMVAAALIVEGTLRENGAEARYREALISGYRDAWHGITNVELQRMQAHAAVISRNEAALRALAEHDTQGYADSLRSTLVTLQDSLIPPQVETITADGELFFTSVDHGGPKRMLTDNPLIQQQLEAAARRSLHPHALDPALTEAVSKTLTPIAGLIQMQDGAYGLVVAFPILSRSGYAGITALYVELDPVLAQFATSTHDRVIVARLDGSLVHATDLELKETLESRPGSLPRTADAAVLRSGNDIFTLVAIPLQDAFEQDAARLLIARDITPIYRRKLLSSVLSYGAVSVVLALFLAGLHWYLRYSFRPLNTVIRVLNALSRGNTQVAVTSIASQDEIGRLAGTVERFRQGQEARNQLELVHRELDTAARIQRSIRPASFPRRVEFSVCAELRTARAVGGDFYDFFDLPDGRFGLVVADVSDKGMGAALFMAVARTAIRTTARIVPEPAECLARANDFLCEDNDSAMFVTTFYGVLDPATGQLVYANAGHLPPYRISSTGVLETLPGTGGMALGVMEAIAFQQRTVVLAAGERLFLYTDGVTDAIDSNAQEFAVGHLEVTLKTAAVEPIEQLVHTVLERVAVFAGQTPQFDDITVMALAYHGATGAE